MKPNLTLLIALLLVPLAALHAADSAKPARQPNIIAPMMADPAAQVRRHAFSEHNWHDYEAHGRSIRSEGFLYLRNNRPLLAWQGPADSVASPSFQQLRAVRDAGKLTPEQADVYLAPRPMEELYRTDVDPDQMRNIALQTQFKPV